MSEDKISSDALFQKGMDTRREALGEAKVAAFEAAKGDFDREFHDLVTAYAWGGVWSRPGLGRDTRSLLSLAMLASKGCWEEFAEHVRATRNTGATPEMIKETLLQVGIYSGVPMAWRAFGIARRVLEEMDSE